MGTGSWNQALVLFRQLRADIGEFARRRGLGEHLQNHARMVASRRDVGALLLAYPALSRMRPTKSLYSIACSFLESCKCIGYARHHAL